MNRSHTWFGLTTAVRRIIVPEWSSADQGARCLYRNQHRKYQTSPASSLLRKFASPFPGQQAATVSLAAFASSQIVKPVFARA